MYLFVCVCVYKNSCKRVCVFSCVCKLCRCFDAHVYHEWYVLWSVFDARVTSSGSTTVSQTTSKMNTTSTLAVANTQSSNTSNGVNVTVIIGACVAGAVVLLASVLIVVIVCVRRRKHQRERVEDSPMPKPQRDANYEELTPVETQYSAMTGQRGSSSVSPRVQNTNSSNANWEIDYSELQLESLLGQGAFGRVFKGLWYVGHTKHLRTCTQRRRHAIQHTQWYTGIICALRDVHS